MEIDHRSKYAFMADCHRGNGEELWENGGFPAIHWVYSDIYIRMGYLHSRGRLIYPWGNHNNISRKPEKVENHLLPALCFYYHRIPSPFLRTWIQGRSGEYWKVRFLLQPMRV